MNAHLEQVRKEQAESVIIKQGVDVHREKIKAIMSKLNLQHPKEVQRKEAV